MRDVADLKAFWEDHVGDVEAKKRWIRGYGDGVGTPSRNWTLDQVEDGERLLDVGCGPGCTYENFAVAHDRDVEYVGIDIADSFVRACGELFPEGDFRQASADDLPFDDGSFDVVLLRHVLEHTLGYEREIAEALRVARRRVVIVTWRPLGEGPDEMRVREGTGGSNDFNRERFWCYLESFGYPILYEEFPGERPNWGWVIEKRRSRPPDLKRQHFSPRLAEPKPTVVFDLDDLVPPYARLGTLFWLKSKYPRLRVTLFAIPALCGKQYVSEIAALDWVEVAVHGWRHVPNDECARWSRAYADVILDRVEGWEFVHGFRPPGWKIGDGVLEALAERGWWIAAHSRDRGRVDSHDGLKSYFSHDPRMVHGHVQDIGHPNPRYRNGLCQLVWERGLPWDEDTEFRFVSEVVE